MVESTCKNYDIDRNKKQRFDYKSDLDYQYYKKYRLIFHYKFYIIRTFGLETWNRLIGMHKFNEIYHISIQTYGETILQGLVDFSANVLGVTIRDLFKYFLAYTRKVEILPFDDFTYID